MLALWVGGSLVLFLLVLVIASFLVDEPLRRYMEREMNRSLKGYSVSLPGLRFHLLGFSVTLKDLTLIQQAYPEPPVLFIPRLNAGVHWRELLRGRLVAEFALNQPQLYVNLYQLRRESSDETAVEDRGWQEAVQAIYPLKVNLLRIEDGDFTYIDEDPEHPLRLGRVNLYATNIRNIRSRERTYPSPFRLEAVVFDHGHAVVDGNADFLAEPFPGVQADYALNNVDLDYFKPVIARLNLSIQQGTFASSGQIEYAPTVKNVHVHDLHITGLKLDYIHTTRTAAAEKRRMAKAREAAKEVSNKPDVMIRIDQLTIAHGALGWRNKAADPPYRVFLTDMDLEIKNLSNQSAQGPAEARLRGHFMGSGTASARAAFRPEHKSPNFDLRVAIEGVQMTKMNDLLRTYGKLDVVAGIFSLYSEVSVKNNRISGYVKPFFRDVDVYDKRQDEEKGIIKKLYEGLAEELAEILENQPREEVATRADISGRMENPDSNTLEIIAGLIRNAFFKAILPGFEGRKSKSALK
jgi:hypothetical protein